MTSGDNLYDGPLGAAPEPGGVRFSVFSEHATRVELCLFDRAENPDPSQRLPLTRGSNGTWSTFVPGCEAGALYGYRVDGPRTPTDVAMGHRFDPSLVLLDPYARALPPNASDAGSSSGTPGSSNLGVVVAHDFDWQGDKPPATQWQDTVVYECHVRGMTRLHPDLPEALRGTYLGLAHSAILEHLIDLGVTAVELLPVQQFATEPSLTSAGRTNYFGYNPQALFAPHASYASLGALHSTAPQVEEFQEMVRTFHEAGLEIILDVVFNHTAEGGPNGSTLSWRGFDNRVYYRLDPKDPRRYVDHSGCGNSLNTAHPAVSRMVLDCLRYWVEVMHVDGFRFDLATSLGRDADYRFQSSGLLRKIVADPLVSRVKLIAEPWDLGPDGYHLGSFPGGWREWNDRFRDTTRSFWRGDPGLVRSLTECLDGSAGIFGERGASAGISFVTCHDGFTLTDLVSYQEKHNEANGEDNRDGSDHNLSRNWGVEGPTESPEILEQRRQITRSLLATLALSRSVPMLSHGDEVGRTQAGNNNAYCHDSELTWIDWSPEPIHDHRAFIAALLRLRRDAGIGRAGPLEFLGADSRPLGSAFRGRSSLASFGAAIEGPGGSILALYNAREDATLFLLPRQSAAGRWRLVLATAGSEPRILRYGSVRLPPYSVLVLRYEPDPPFIGS